MTEFLLRARGLAAWYGPTLVVEDVDLDVLAGEVLTIFGPNGSGKSTILRSVCAAMEFYGGSSRARELTLCGTSALGMSINRLVARGLSFVPAGGRIFPQLTVAQNVELGGYLIRNRREVEKRLRATLDRIALPLDIRDRRGGDLSRGERQLVALARALMVEPRVILLDEPTAGLAEDRAEEIFRLLRREADDYRRGVAIVEHNLAGALSISERACLVKMGRMSRSFRKEEFSGIRPAMGAPSQAGS